jgi:two-component system copper resistance phosphate regulon response regulator CusR
MQSSILVVEGDEVTAQLLLRALTSAGFDVAIAASGQRASELFDQGRFAVVVLDAQLPDVDGFALLLDLVAGAPSVPIMLLSALDDVESKVLAFELGACDYLTTPLDPAELVARVRRRASVVSQAPQLLHARWSLEPQRRVVDDGRRTVALSALEWRLLEHLISREGAICTRDELVERVWGVDTKPRANVVDVCIRRLRRKLGPDAVITVRGAGYRLG